MVKISVITPSIRPEFLDITQKCLENQTYQNFEWLVEIGLRNKGFRLPTDWNKLLKRSAGEIIVLLQDCIRIPDNALEEIEKLYTDDKTAYTFPVGKTLDFSLEPVWDWRKHANKKIQPFEWEIDFGMAPRALFFDVGGFDEDFNNGWSWENVEIAYRAEACGYNFRCVKDITGIALDHDLLTNNPFRSKENNSERAEQTRISAISGDFKKNYL